MQQGARSFPAAHVRRSARLSAVAIRRSLLFFSRGEAALRAPGTGALAVRPHCPGRSSSETEKVGEFFVVMLPEAAASRIALVKGTETERLL